MKPAYLGMAVFRANGDIVRKSNIDVPEKQPKGGPKNIFCYVAREFEGDRYPSRSGIWSCGMASRQQNIVPHRLVGEKL